MTVTLDRTPHSRSKDPASILEHFASLPDPRRDHGKVHMLDEILFMSICGVVCGADSWQEIADYSRSKEDWLKTFLTLPGGIPSHDTFRRVFCLLDPLAFQKCFANWMTALMEQHGLITIRRSSCAEADCHRWENPAWFGSSHHRSVPPAHGERLVGGESPDVGPSGDSREIERNHGDSRAAQAFGSRGSRGDD